MPTSKPYDMKHILILILCAFVLACKSTKTASSSNESERNAVSQAQWRSAQNLSFSSLQRLTALSFDSCVFTFGGVDTSATPQCSDLSYPSGKPLSNDKAKPPSYHGKPSAISHGKPSSLKLYGLHLSQEEKEESAAAQQVEDSIAIAKQSSSDKSQEIIKSRSSVPFTAKLAIAVLMMITAVAVIFLSVAISPADDDISVTGSRIHYQAAPAVHCSVARTSHCMAKCNCGVFHCVPSLWASVAK